MTEEIKQAQRQSGEEPAKPAEKKEPPLTLTQKIVMTILVLYVISLVWLVLSHHWLGWVWAPF